MWLSHTQLLKRKMQRKTFGKQQYHSEDDKDGRQNYYLHNTQRVWHQTFLSSSQNVTKDVKSECALPGQMTPNKAMKAALAPSPLYKWRYSTTWCLKCTHATTYNDL